MTGTVKKMPFAIGSSKNPNCFKTVKHLPVNYAHSRNLWMTTATYTDFFSLKNKKNPASVK